MGPLIIKIYNTERKTASGGGGLGSDNRLVTRNLGFRYGWVSIIVVRCINLAKKRHTAAASWVG